MKCNHFFEITSSYDNYSKVMQLVHRFHTQTEQRIAVAFPKIQTGEQRSLGPLIRFWHDEPETLEQLKKDLLFYKLGNVSDIKKRPEQIDQYVVYRHFKVPSRNTKGTPEQNRKSAIKRMEKIVLCETLPYVVISSSSTRQEFPLNVLPIASDATTDGQLDSYGLSLANYTAVPEWSP